MFVSVAAARRFRRQAGQAGVADTRRAAAPWYRSKAEPSTLDMLVTLRRQIIATRFLPSTPRPATTQEIIEVQQAWAQAAA
jgi:hypothetical protein